MITEIVTKCVQYASRWHAGGPFYVRHFKIEVDGRVIKVAPHFVEQPLKRRTRAVCEAAAKEIEEYLTQHPEWSPRHQGAEFNPNGKPFSPIQL